MIRYWNIVNKRRIKNIKQNRRNKINLTIKKIKIKVIEKKN